VPNDQSLQRILHRQRRCAHAAIERPRTPPGCCKQFSEFHDWQREVAKATAEALLELARATARRARKEQIVQWLDSDDSAVRTFVLEHFGKALRDPDGGGGASRD
jgi:hypothetical protein